MVKRIAHVGIATKSISTVAEFYKSLGLEIGMIEVNDFGDVLNGISFLVV